MKQPIQSGDQFLQDVADARPETDAFHLWWLGQSGYLVQWQGRHLLIDPYLSDSLTKKYARTDKPHIRMTARVTAPERLDFIDMVTSSHNHTDHLDGETLGPLLRVNPDLLLVVPEANREFAAERLGIDLDRPLGICDGTSVSAAGFRITGLPAAHNELETDALGQHKFMGYIIEFGPWTLYHSGDSLWYDGLEERLGAWRIDVALLPINGNKPERRVAGNLDGEEAARLAHQVGARIVIPCHYDMFTFNTASPDRFVAACEALGQPYRVLENGERWSSRMLTGEE